MSDNIVFPHRHSLVQFKWRVPSVRCKRLEPQPWIWNTAKCTASPPPKVQCTMTVNPVMSVSKQMVAHTLCLWHRLAVTSLHWLCTFEIARSTLVDLIPVLSNTIGVLIVDKKSTQVDLAMPIVHNHCGVSNLIWKQGQVSRLGCHRLSDTPNCTFHIYLL